MAVTNGTPIHPSKKRYRAPATRSLQLAEQPPLLMLTCGQGFDFCEPCNCCVEQGAECPPEL